MIKKMDPNLFIKNVGYKHLLLRKLSCSVLCSVLSQLLILILFLLLMNFSIVHPFEWITVTFSALLSMNTWLFFIPFLTVVFAQAVICAKDYVLKETYCTTRFEKIFSVISIRNVFIFVLHALTGGLIVWLYLMLAGGKYENLYVPCLKDSECLVDGTFYMILGGIWSGVYYFFCVYMTRKHLLFPVINQSKFLQFKTNIFSLLKESKSAAFWPTFYYFLVQYIWGDEIKSCTCGMLGINTVDENNMSIYAYIYVFTVLYFFNMNLMAFFFTLFLTEPVEFSLVACDENTATLQEAIKVNSLPIVQKLACLDLDLISFWSAQRRQILFSLSQPGGHPYVWNNFVDSILILFKEYTDLLNKSADSIILPSQVKKQEQEWTKEIEQSCIKSPQKFSNVRNMSMSLLDPLNIVDVSYQKSPYTSAVYTESLGNKAAVNFKNLITKVKKKLGYNYLFDELPEMTIQKCLANGQIIMWTAEGISTLAVLSIKEDRFGIVQKDLPAIITSLVELKQSIDKLNKVPGLNRKSVGYRFYYNMKLGVAAAVRRSLINIGLHFGDYIQDFSLKSDILLQLKACAMPERN